MDIQDLVENAKKLRQDGNNEEAESLLRAAINNDKNEWALWNQLGHVLVAKTDYNDAVDAFRKATELDSSSFF
ncbi:MAG: tetratricopeptide repeat protein, partial [Candidatus Thorarchaeota archaeon]